MVTWARRNSLRSWSYLGGCWWCVGDVGDDGGDEGKLKKPLLLDADDGVSPPPPPPPPPPASPNTNFGGQMKNPLAGGLIADPCCWLAGAEAAVAGLPVFHNWGIMLSGFYEIFLNQVDEKEDNYSIRSQATAKWPNLKPPLFLSLSRSLPSKSKGKFCFVFKMGISVWFSKIGECCCCCCGCVAPALSPS